MLVQKQADDPGLCYAFPGGGFEFGDTLLGRLALEFEEETGARMVEARYLFVVENRLLLGGRLIYGLEHYFAVRLDREEIESREEELSFHWLPVAGLKEYDLRPWMVRDVVAEGRLEEVRHLVVPLEGGSA